MLFFRNGFIFFMVLCKICISLVKVIIMFDYIDVLNFLLEWNKNSSLFLSWGRNYFIWRSKIFIRIGVLWFRF